MAIGSLGLSTNGLKNHELEACRSGCVLRNA
jgi:hypothetical protein